MGGSAANVRAGRTSRHALTKYFRPGDIFTHMSGGFAASRTRDTKGQQPTAMDRRRRKRGVFFDVGHGAAVFAGAVPSLS